MSFKAEKMSPEEHEEVIEHLVNRKRLCFLRNIPWEWTIDRENKITLLYLGMTDRDIPWEKGFLLLFGDLQLNSVVQFWMKEHHYADFVEELRAQNNVKSVEVWEMVDNPSRGRAIKELDIIVEALSERCGGEAVIIDRGKYYFGSFKPLPGLPLLTINPPPEPRASVPETVETNDGSSGKMPLYEKIIKFIFSK